MLDRIGLTSPQFDVLATVDKLGEAATPRAIAERLLVTRGNVTGLLKRLKARGLLATRVHAHDGRSFVCVLTKDGEEALGRGLAAAQLFVREQLAPFSADELAVTSDIMQRMQRHLETLAIGDLADRLTSEPHNHPSNGSPS
jgi:DNA-binding MarR family transcriptional regulator